MIHGVTAAVAAHVLVVAALIVRVMLRRHRQPTSRVAWVAVIAAVPVFGIVAYLFLGEVRVGQGTTKRLKRALGEIAEIDQVLTAGSSDMPVPTVPEGFAHLYDVGKSISGFDVVGGNSANLMLNSNDTVESMVRDMDAATDHIHLLFYIWLSDHNGLKVVEALKRAAERGVACRAMADGLGSRALIRSEHWTAMRDAGVAVAVALPIGNIVRRVLSGRIDLRNHRKIVVIDDRITYCGSQNCADPEFLVKAKFAPWVDAVARFQGPVVRQNQQLFASDWAAYSGEDLSALLRQPMRETHSGFAAQVIGTGPTVRPSAMPEMFRSLMESARHRLVITTPYYVPNESMQSALCAAAYRGVDTTIVFPANNDSWIVGGASRSYYEELLEAGVKIHEFEGGLLHTKSLTVDGQMTLIGSANMDRRSFELNYENNILVSDEAFTTDVFARQMSYVAGSHQVTADQVASWSRGRRLWNNVLATLSPVL